MMVSEVFLEKLSKILNEVSGVDLPGHSSQPTASDIDQLRLKAQGQWVSAIAALESLLLSHLSPKASDQGLILSGPTPTLCHPTLTHGLHIGIFSLQFHQAHGWQPFQSPISLRLAHSPAGRTVASVRRPRLVPGRSGVRRLHLRRSTPG